MHRNGRLAFHGCTLPAVIFATDKRGSGRVDVVPSLLIFDSPVRTVAVGVDLQFPKQTARR